MNIGDKVRILRGIRTGQTGTIELINDTSGYLIKDEDGSAWYYGSELEPVMEHMTAEEVNFASGTADNTNQRTASGVDPYTAEIGDPVIKYWYDQGYKDGHDKGYRTGMQAVITNIKRFLEEITP